MCLRTFLEQILLQKRKEKKILVRILSIYLLFVLFTIFFIYCKVQILNPLYDIPKNKMLAPSFLLHFFLKSFLKKKGLPGNDKEEEEETYK